MANMRRERKAFDLKGRQQDRLANATREGLREAAMETAREIEIPLREAIQIVRVLSLVEKPRTDDGEAIAFIRRRGRAPPPLRQRHAGRPLHRLPPRRLTTSTTPASGHAGTPAIRNAFPSRAFALIAPAGWGLLP